MTQAAGITAEIGEYAAPETLAEAVELMADSDATVLAGGTDLMVQIDQGRRSYGARLVNIRRIGEMRGIAIDDDQVRIGALTTVTDILNDQTLKVAAPVLAQTADRFASNQLRNMATIGGNLCNASPAGDMIIPLMVLDATVVLSSWQDCVIAQRLVPLADFFTGPSQTVIAPYEILSEIRFAKPASGFKARYVKSGPRPALEISTVSAGFGAVRGGGLSNVRLALGAVAPTPLRAIKTEAFLEGKSLSSDVIAEAAEIAADEATPIDDVRATGWYRTHLTRVFVKRLLEDDHQG